MCLKLKLFACAEKYIDAVSAVTSLDKACLGNDTLSVMKANNESLIVCKIAKVFNVNILGLKLTIKNYIKDGIEGPDIITVNVVDMDAAKTYIVKNYDVPFSRVAKLEDGMEYAKDHISYYEFSIE